MRSSGGGPIEAAAGCIHGRPISPYAGLATKMMETVCSLRAQNAGDREQAETVRALFGKDDHLKSSQIFFFSPSKNLGLAGMAGSDLKVKCYHSMLCQTHTALFTQDLVGGFECSEGGIGDRCCKLRLLNFFRGVFP